MSSSTKKMIAARFFSNAGLGFKKLEVVSKAVNFEVFFRRTPNVECPLASRTGHGYFAGTYGS